MSSKKLISILGTILGVVMICISIILFLNYGESLNNIAGLLIGIGSGIFGVSLGTIISINGDRKDPERKVLRDIEIKDERNLSIREKAAFKTNSIMTYLLSGVILLGILLNASTFFIITLVIILNIKCIMNAFYINRFGKSI